MKNVCAVEPCWDSAENPPKSSICLPDWPLANWRKLLNYVHPFQFEAGIYLIRRYQVQSDLIVLLTGRVEIVEAAYSKLLGEYVASGVFGEDTFLAQQTPSISLRTLTNGTCLIVTHKRFKAFMSSEPRLAVDFARQLAGITSLRRGE